MADNTLQVWNNLVKEGNNTTKVGDNWKKDEIGGQKLKITSFN